MKKNLLFLAIILISINSCKKDLKPAESGSITTTISSDEIVNWLSANPLVKTSQLKLDAARQKVVDGNPVVRIRISSKSDIYFTKEKGLFKAYLYKWDDKSPGADKYTGNIYVYNFQTQMLEQLVYNNGKISGFGHLLSIGNSESTNETGEAPNGIKNKQKVNVWIPVISELWCWITGGAVVTSGWRNDPPQCNYLEGSGIGDNSGGGGGPESLAGYLDLGYSIVDANGGYNGSSGGGTGGNGGGLTWGPPPPPCDPSYSPTENGTKRLKVNGNIGLGCPPAEDGQWQPYTIVDYSALDTYTGDEADEPDDDADSYTGPTQRIPSTITLNNGQVVKVLFGTTTTDHLNADNAVSVKLVNLLIQALNVASQHIKINSIFIMATTNGQHTNRPPDHVSNHYKMLAIDLSRINGIPLVVQGASEMVKQMQLALDQNPDIRENFGPYFKHKFGQPYNTTDGSDHIHFSTNP